MKTGWQDAALNPLANPCNWYGVTCDEFDRVAELNLFGNNLGGSLPTEIGDLRMLKRLFLSQNEIGGTLPKELNNLIQLEDLSLAFNEFTGPLPDLDALALLVSLAAQSNELDGPLPASLNSLTALTFLRLDENRFDGPIPDLSGLAGLSFLDLSGNRLSGSLPTSLGALTELTTLRWSRNNFSGCYPASYVAFCGLTFISFAVNDGLPDGGSRAFFNGTFCPDGTACGLLPVAWLSFMAMARGKSVSLAWTTAAETNSDYFAVERSTEGEEWTELGRVAATGNSTNRQKYAFTAGGPAMG